MRARSFHQIGGLVVVLIGILAVSFSAAAQGHSSGFHATTHGSPPSVTSFGFGGHPGFHGVPASVTSPNFGNTPFQFHRQFHERPIFSPRRHRDHAFGYPFYGDVFAVPYAYPVYADDSAMDDSVDEQDYREPPPVFAHRIGPNRDEEDYRTPRTQTAPDTDVANQPRTVLVFKDGRQREILNYAIVGTTLFDLTDGLTKKVALAELDLPATVKQNDDRGIEFQLPASLKNN